MLSLYGPSKRGRAASALSSGFGGRMQLRQGFQIPRHHLSTIPRLSTNGSHCPCKLQAQEALSNVCQMQLKSNILVEQQTHSLVTIKKFLEDHEQYD